MKTANKIIKQAIEWIGKKESDGSHKEIIDIYNSHKPLARNYKMKYTDHWCATFVSALSIKLGYTDIIPTECSCEKMISLFKNINIWVENEDRTPNNGDIIFYDWDDSGNGDNKGWSDHVGIVEKVSNGKITVIEGNYSNAVKRRTIAVNGKCIRGYATPKYDVENVENYVNNSTMLDELVAQTLQGKYGNGEERKKKLGAMYDAVQNKINEMYKKQNKKETTYIVKYGDTLSTIAKKFNTTVEKIVKDNNIKNANKIYANQKLVIK